MGAINLAPTAVFLLTNVQPRLVARRQHSILELEGLGKELWQGIDVDQYLEEERNSWDREAHCMLKSVILKVSFRENAGIIRRVKA